MKTVEQLSSTEERKEFIRTLSRDEQERILQYLESGQRIENLK